MIAVCRRTLLISLVASDPSGTAGSESVREAKIRL